MQFLKLLVLPVAVGLDYRCNQEPFKAYSVRGKIGNKQFVYVLRKRRKIFVKFKNVY